MDHDPEAAGRRTFLRRLGGQAVEGAGRLAGLSGAMRRSVMAAGDAAVRELAPAAPGDMIPDQAVAASRPVPAPSAVIPAPPRPRPEAPSLTASELAFLRSARSGALAVNDPGGAPHVSQVDVTWAEDLLRIPTAMLSARANAVDRDPRVSLLVHDPEPGGVRWVIAVGAAALESDPTDADRAVIVIRPTRFTWQIG